MIIMSVYRCVILRSPSTSEHPLVTHSFKAPNSVINDVAGHPFSSTLDETAGTFLIIAYSMWKAPPERLPLSDFRNNIGCFPLYQMIFRNFGREKNLRLGLRGNFLVKMLHLQRYRLFTVLYFSEDHRDRELCVPATHLAWVSKLHRWRGRFGRKRENTI